jgi:hypothetical protein
MTTTRKTPTRRKPRSTTAVIALWAGRHLWSATRWSARKAGTHTVRVITYSGKTTATKTRDWASERAEFGFRTGVVRCACGTAVPFHQQDTHTCLDKTTPAASAFTGSEVRAHEPVRAKAVRLDKTTPTSSSRPVLSRKERKQRLRDLQTHLTPISEIRAMEAERIKRERYARQIAAGRPLGTVPERYHPTTDPTPTPGMAPMKEITIMNDPTNWASSAEVLAEPNLTDPLDAIAYFELLAKGASKLDDHMATLSEYFHGVEHMDRPILDLMGMAREHANGIHEAFTNAHKYAAEAWVSTPNFQKAS